MDENETENAAETDQPAPKRRLKASHVIAVLLAVGAVLWIASGMIGEDKPEVAAETGAAKPAGTVDVRVTELMAVDRPRHISVFGRTDAILDAEIKAETAGQVVARPARKGTTVAKGTVLVELAMDDRLAKLRDAEAKLGSAKINYAASKNLSQKQFESQTKLAESNAALAAAEAALAAITLDIARTKIAAPIDGYIERLEPGPGDTISVGDVVALVVDLDPIRVVVYVGERDVGDIAVDDKAAVTLPNGAKFEGRVNYVSRLANSVTRAFRVDIWLENPDSRIPAGQTAEVSLVTGHHKAHQVRKSALTLDDKGALGVKTVDADDTVRFLPVKIIDDAPEGVWIEGLPDSARVITLGQEFVVDGQKVRPVTETATRAAGGAGS